MSIAQRSRQMTYSIVARPIRERMSSLVINISKIPLMSMSIIEATMRETIMDMLQWRLSISIVIRDSRSMVPTTKMRDTQRTSMSLRERSSSPDIMLNQTLELMMSGELTQRKVLPVSSTMTLSRITGIMFQDPRSLTNHGGKAKRRERWSIKRSSTSQRVLLSEIRPRVSLFQLLFLQSFRLRKRTLRVSKRI